MGFCASNPLLYNTVESSLVDENPFGASVCVECTCTRTLKDKLCDFELQVPAFAENIVFHGTDERKFPLH